MFAKYVEEGLSGDDLEELYTKVHEAIREDPTPAPKSGYQPDKAYKKKPKDSKVGHTDSHDHTQAAQTITSTALHRD